MKTSLILAFLATTALSASAMAQSTGTTGDTGSTSTTGAGSGDGSTTQPTGSSASSPSTGANSGSGGTSGSSGSSGSSGVAPGSQSPNPNVYGSDSGAAPSGGWQQNGGGAQQGQGWGGGPWGMMQGMMTCVSPAPMGGPGSFACYPAQQMGWGNMGWGNMGWGGMGWGGMGWGGRGRHPHMFNHGFDSDGGREDYSSPNDYWQDRQNDRRNRERGNGWQDNSNGFDNGGGDYPDDQNQ